VEHKNWDTFKLVLLIGVLIGVNTSWGNALLSLNQVGLSFVLDRNDCIVF